MHPVGLAGAGAPGEAAEDASERARCTHDVSHSSVLMLR